MLRGTEIIYMWGVQKVGSLTQKETMNAENTLPALSSTYCINTA